MKSKANLFLFGSVLLIFMGMAIVAILNRNTGSASSTDVRARAANTYTLKLKGTVTEVNEAKGTIAASNVYFDDTNRSGEQQNLGNWTVTAPPTFNFASVSPGVTITIGVAASTFNVASHALTALTLTAGN